MATVDAEFEKGLGSSSRIIWLVVATVLVFLIWAKFAWVDEIVRADGQIISAARPQIVQNLEGGILAELLVSEGSVVEPGQVLARLRGTQFQAAVDDLADQLVAASIRRTRLEAEMAGQTDFEVAPIFAQHSPTTVASERALLQARQADYQSRISGAQAVLRETERELASMEDMYRREIVALFEVTNARKAHSDAQNRYNDIVTGAELERANEYSEVLQIIGTLTQELRMAQDQLNRTVIVAPMRGVVNNLAVTTIGGVVRPGEEIFQIIPLDDELFVEAHVKPEDIANVRTGQDANIKLSAYDYTIYGTLNATVDFISADTFKDDRRPDIPPHYKVTLRVDLSNLTDRQREIEIRPGMQATVELHTGGKTVLQYLTKPLYRGSEALRER
ncbi:transporter [Aestuarium zhoushanense]|uniref:HlyD family efflux transporter periplasmic adaptor subunit n=1 Tax=Marivivens donghaensis TaxID=1699413 RepID=UPI000CA37E92|nr:HlyD family efflux transporter periplasmic adaptor subunit [Marivivens donghaensis]AUJ64648.1 transporter [Aestuarium zhoushanense]MCL7408219.1 HlyD family efflux transporter periplasmic adaptor subunit [Marivivens donghaensis]MDN3705010.1 HlyD family efflux transporter periplasmic adaptor subunit [Marivivens donghaensis]